MSSTLLCCAKWSFLLWYGDVTLKLTRFWPCSVSACQMEQPSMEQKGHANVPWIVEPGQEAKRGVNTKYETTIF